MKTRPIIKVSVVVLAVVVALVSWHLLKFSRDTSVKKNLTGIWVDSSSSRRVEADGHYVIVSTNATTGTVTTNEGMLDVKGGFMIVTITRSSRTNVPLPFSSHARVVRVGDREVVTIEGDTGSQTNIWRKVSP